MRFKKKGDDRADGDLTPMIDMTFQLIAFFMVIVNFSEAEQDARVKLPESRLAKPPEVAPENHFTIQMDEKSDVIVDGRVVSLDSVDSLLNAKSRMYDGRGDVIGDVVVILRAHENAPTGKVQDLVKACQDARFETFVLRAKEKR